MFRDGGFKENIFYAEFKKEKGVNDKIKYKNKPGIREKASNEYTDTEFPFAWLKPEGAKKCVEIWIYIYIRTNLNYTWEWLWDLVRIFFFSSRRRFSPGSHSDHCKKFVVFLPVVS